MVLKRPLRWPFRALCCGAVFLAALLCADFGGSRANGASLPNRQGHSSTGTKSDSKSDGSHMTKLKLHVITPDGKPVSNASVYVRFPVSGGLLRHKKLQELDLKTDDEGSVKVPEIPQGKVMVQVIAKDWHLFGKWYDVEKPADSIVIKLKQPPHWY